MKFSDKPKRDVTVIFKRFLAVLAIFAGSVQAEEPRIDSSKAAFHVGSTAMVCGVVSEVKNFSKGVYLNMGPTYPNQHVSVLIWADDVAGFDTRFGGLSVFGGKRVCARGLIEVYRNSLQIKVSNPQFLRLMQSVK